MSDLSFSSETWKAQASLLQPVAADLSQVCAAAQGTMTGTPFGLLFTPLCGAIYDAITEEAENTANQLAQSAQRLAAATSKLADDFAETESELQALYADILKGLEQ